MKLKHNTVFLTASRVTVDPLQIWYYTLSCASLFSHDGATDSRRARMHGEPSLYNPAQKQRPIYAPASSRAHGSCRLTVVSWLTLCPISLPQLEKSTHFKRSFKINRGFKQTTPKYTLVPTISHPTNMLHVKHLPREKCLQR